MNVRWRGWLVVASFCFLQCGNSTPVLLDLQGREVRPLQHPTAPVTVFLFTSSECPISNVYAPRIRATHERFADRGVALYLVYPDRDDTPERIRAHREQFAYAWDALRDPEHALVARAEARVTPEVAVLLSDDDGTRFAYRGRIDNLYSDYGKSRAEASVFDLRDSLEAVLDGRPVPNPRTRAVGCPILDLK